MNRILVLLIAFVLAGCGSGVSNSPISYKIQTGHAEKGPLQAGSTIMIIPLNDNVESTGNVLKTTTYDDLGHFNLSQPLPSKLVEIIGEGCYLDETTGEFSDAKVTLRGILDLSVESSPTINLLSTLQVNRLRSLVRSGMSYEAANQMSQEEVLNVFGLSKHNIPDLTKLYQLKIDGSGDGDAVLLAVSTILITAAQERNGASTVAELSDIMYSIAWQLEQSGRIIKPALAAELVKAAAKVDKAAARSNIEKIFSSRGFTVTVPVFEDWVNSVAMGVSSPVRTKVSPDDFSFADYTEANPSTQYASDIITVSGMEPGVHAFVSLTGGGGVRIDGFPFPLPPGVIVKNGTRLTTTNTFVTNGDRIQLLSLSPQVFKNAKTATLTIGTKSASWKIVNHDPELAVPADFSFNNKVFFVGTPVWSNEIIISGLNPGASARVTVSQYGWGNINGTNVSLGRDSYVTVKNGDRLHIIASGFNSCTMTVQIGVKQATWTVSGAIPIYDGLLPYPATVFRSNGLQVVDGALGQEMRRGNLGLLSYAEPCPSDCRATI